MENSTVIHRVLCVFGGHYVFEYRNFNSLKFEFFDFNFKFL
jgi:hypothetical protein